MKKIIIILLVALLSANVPAQEFSISGEAKSGILWTKTENRISDPDERTNAGSKDDAGSGAGRFRVNIEYSQNNIGFKVRFNWEDWASAPQAALWSYAFAYGNFYNDQLTLSIGKLGASPWGTGGPDMWRELERVGSTGGIRTEYKPWFIPGLNVGFVLNGFDGYTDMWPAGSPITFLDVLQESVLGASYTHDYFHVRAAFRLDSKVDNKDRGAPSGEDGGDLVYRLEERALRNYLPGFSIGALGYWQGLGAGEANREGVFRSENWLFVRYEPDLFSATIRFGYDVIWNRSILHIRPSFYWNFFDKLIVAGASYLYAQDFGDGKLHKGSPYYYMAVEPLVQVNISSNAYVAFAYNWRMDYILETDVHRERGIEPLKQTQWANLRFGLTF